MARSHWYFAASTAAVLAAAAIACGDSATGADIPEPDEDGGTQRTDSGTRDGGGNPNNDSGSNGGFDSGGVDSGPRGDGGLPNVSATTLEFGEVDCGTTAAPKTFTINNPSSASISFSGELVKGATSGFTIAPLTGTIPAGGSVDVTVTPKAVGTVGVSTNTNALGDTLKLAIGPTNSQVELRQTAHGVRLSLNATKTAFGNVSTTAGEVTLPFALANAGNQTAPVTVTFVDDNTTDPSTFSLSDAAGTGPVPTTATPGNTGALVKFKPTDLVSYSGKLHVEIGAGVVLCDTAPADLTFTGKGTDGVVGISATDFNFGNPGRTTTDCGSTAPLQTLRVSNSSSTAFTITAATLGKGTNLFKLQTTGQGDRASLTNVTVPANLSVDIIITPQPIPQNHTTNPTTPDAFADTITLTTNAPGDIPAHVITLHQTARGAYVTRNPNTAPNLGTVAVGTTSAPTNFTWQNVGNVDINLTQSLALNTVFALTPAELALGVGAPPVTASVTFTPTATGAAPADTMSVVQKAGETAVMCTSNLPAPLAVNGIGGSASIVANNSATNSTIAFGGIACGTAAPAGRTLSVRNNGPATNFTATLRKGVGSPFSLSSPGGPIAAGATVNLTVTPNPVTNTIGTIAEQSDAVEITADGVASPPVVTVNYTPQGAMFTFTNTSNANVLNLAFPTNQKVATTSPTQNIRVTNTGNLAAALNITTNVTSPAGAPASVFTGVPTTATVQPGGANLLITALSFTPATNVAYQGNWTVTPATGAILCAPLPQGQSALNGVIPLTGTGVP